VGAEEPGQPERALARELGVAGRVRFMGPQDDVRTVLHAADAFVMPSLREGLPISALEALATGLPAVLADAPGLRDLRLLFPGVLWAKPAAAPLAGALRRFAALEARERWALAREHAAIARREFGMRAGVEAYLRLYRGRA
jgi:glycosyltransferase involved in cell wall biosynthesis